MQDYPQIRSFFKPLQPSLQPGHEKILYQELSPDPRLKELIYCYWQLQTLVDLKEPFVYRVVADGCMDLMFDLNQPGTQFIIGFAANYSVFELPTPFNYIGVRFMPAAFPLLFRMDAGELTDRFESLQQVLPKLAKQPTLILEPKHDLLAAKKLFDPFFLRQLDQLPAALDFRVLEALQKIIINKGQLRLEQGLGTGLSPRQLRRLFRFYVGTSPKVFSKVIRFQNVLQLDTDPASFYDLGYYDQAHFIKEFKTFFGRTPGDLSKS